jgi:bla regulator protein blaR1
VTGAITADAAAWVAVALAELTLVLALAWTIDALTASRLRPHLRHGLWTLVGIRMLVPPGLIRWPGAASGIVPVEASLAGATLPIVSVPAFWLLGFWVLGAGVLATRWGLRARRARARLTNLDEEDAGVVRAWLAPLARRVGLGRMPAVSVDPAAQAPYVTGLRAPRLILPFDWRHWSRETLDHALAHELMHLVRRDLRMEAAWMAAACLYWFHPLVHVARRRAHESREMCCDADVASLLGPQYRLTLLRVMAALFAENQQVVSGVAPGQHAWHPAVARLRALERWPGPPPRRHRVAGAALLIVAACLVIPSHVTILPRAHAAVPIERLIDPVSRQELGMGSLHLRYALMGEERAGTSGDPPARTVDR